MRLALMLLLIAALAACTSPPTDAPEPSRAPWELSDHAGALRTASCPEEVSYTRASAIDLTVTPIDPGDDYKPATHSPGATYVGGWHLTSEDPNFGGLSGLETLASGNLLAVTDEGAFVWINLGENGAPETAHMSYMRGEDGLFIAGKGEKDAEGLAMQDGLALVSFERNHRVLAFDLEGCGSAARGAPVADFGDRISGMSRDMESNGGVEGLSLHPAFGTLTLGIETPDDLGMPLALLTKNGVAEASFWRQDDERARITGLDRTPGGLFMVRRDFRPGYGNDILVEMMDGDELTIVPLIRLDPSVKVDNFEGIAAVETETGVRLWLISDNNFSNRQRTLLFAFDVEL